MEEPRKALPIGTSPGRAFDEDRVGGVVACQSKRGLFFKTFRRCEMAILNTTIIKTVEQCDV